MEYITKLRNTLMKKEEDYLRILYGTDLELLNEKILKVIHQMNSKKQEKNKTEIIIKHIRILSINKGGFINFENRKEIYKNIFEYISTYNSYAENENLKENEILRMKNNFHNEISQDFSRSNLLNTIIETNDLSEEELQLFLNDLKKFSFDFFDENRKMYEYYQGFQDICLLSFILNIILSNHEDNTFYLKNLSQLHFHKFLNKHKKIKFEILISILSDLIEEINPNINKNILELTNSPPYYALSWIITWFSHKNSNIFFEFRIIDYLICSPPIAIFYLVSVVSRYIL